MADEGILWQVTEVTAGRFAVESDKYRISVFADFSGNITDVYGNTLEFPDLRAFISAAKILEQALTDHYGGT